MHSPREHFHTYLHSLDVDRGGLPEEFRQRLARVLAHYGVTDLDRTPTLEEAVFRVFLAQQRTRPGRRCSSRRCCSSGSPSRRRSTPLDEQAHEVLDRLVRGDPAAVPGRRRAGPQRHGSAGSTSRWSTQAPGRGAGRGARRARLPRRPIPDAAGLRRAPRGARRDPRADRAVPRRTARAAASPSASRCSRCWSRRHYREHELHDLRELTVDGRPFVDRRLHPGRPADPAGDHSRHLGELAESPASGLVTRPGRRRSTPGTAGHEAVVDLYLHWPGLPGDRRGGVRSLQAVLGRPAARPAGTPGGGRRLPRRRTPGAPTSPSAPGRAGVRRGRPRPRRAPDGRPAAEPVAAARLRHHPARRARGRAALPLRGAATTSPTSGWSRWPRCAQLAVVRDEDGQVDLAAARRAGDRQLPGGDPPGAHRARRGRRPAGHEPRLGAHLAGGRRPARAADRAAAQHRAADGRRRDRGGRWCRAASLGAGRHCQPAGRPVLLPARVRRRRPSVERPPTERLAPLDDYAQKVLRARRRGTVYPYEVCRHARRAGRHASSSTTSTTPVRWCR